MTAILDWGIAVILWCQRFSPTLDLPFKVFTFAGDEMFFLLFLPLLYWSIDRRFGIRLTVLFLVSAYANALVKAIVDQPRPFTYDTRVSSLIEETGGGLPSGHTQGTTVVWGYLAWWFRQRWLWAVAVVMLVMVPLSRVYLGVHFPTDLLGGYLIGLLLLGLFVNIEPALSAWIAALGLLWKIGLSIGVAVILWAVFPGTDSNAVSAAGTLLGCLLGLTFERRWVRFASSGSIRHRVLRYLIGLVLMLVVYFGLRVLFSGLEPVSVFRFLRYGVIGLVLTLAVPLIFVRIGIAGRE